MKAQSIQLDGQPVMYYESAGRGPAILLIHGNSSSGRTFQKQFESALGETYHLVALDLPGFGLSQPVTAPEAVMGLQGWASIVEKLISALGISQAILVGWSLGGHVALEAIGALPDAKGIWIYGTPPIAFPPAMEQAFLPHPAMAYSFAAEMSEEQMDAYVTAFFAPGVTDLPEVFREDIRRSDGRARAAVGGSIRPDGYADEVEVVAGLTVPLAIIQGEYEQLVNPEYFADLPAPTLWRGAVQPISAAGHAPHWEQPEQFNALLDAFTKDCLG